jgi:hypothetical protein
MVNQQERHLGNDMASDLQMRIHIHPLVEDTHHTHRPLVLLLKKQVDPSNCLR